MDLANLWIEPAVIVALILATGFFSAAELATVSLRQSRIAQLIKEGRRGAKAVEALKEQPARFLATVQVGITVVSSMASVLGGASAVAIVQPLLEATGVPFVQRWAAPIALGTVVAVISYLSLVLGELVPKSLALRHAEAVGCFSAPIIHRLAQLTHPMVRALTWSTDLLMHLLGSRGTSRDAFVSEEEIKHIVGEGADRGIFDEAERELIHSVFEFTDTSVREVMVPRNDIHAIELHTTPRAALDRMLATGFSRAPVFEQDLDKIVGIVHIKDLLRSLSHEPPLTLGSVLHPAIFIPDSMQISDLMREIQTRRAHMTIVLNEYGTVIGLVTIEDLLEEIVGEIRDEFDSDEELPIQEQPDGSLLVDGSVTLAELNSKYELPLEETRRYHTVGGFVMARLKRMPKGGETINHAGLTIKIVTIEGRRLRKIRIERPAPPAPPAEPAP
jgi:putative hemolysin